jgi:putative membrane protein
MTPIVLARYIHFIAVFAIVGALVAEQFVVTKSMTRKQIKTTFAIDGIYGLGALLVIVAGLILWFWVGKPAEFYTKNWIFHTKLTLFVLLGLLSIYPSVFFFKNRKGHDLNEQIDVPKLVMVCLRLELILLFLIPIAATLMSLGIGSFQ